MSLYYDSLDLACKSIRGGIFESEELKITVKTSGIVQCRLVLRYDGEDAVRYDMTPLKDGFSIVLSGLKSGLIWYGFSADDAFYGDNGNCKAEQGSRDFFQLLVCKNRRTVNYSDKIMYQIMPDRFSRAEGCGDASGKRIRPWGETPEYLPNKYGKITNDDFFGGNFKGIIDKLPYLKSIGVSAIYLNPIFKAKSNHRYDTGDYFQIDGLLGNIDDYAQLVTQCRKQDICIILDGVFNHTGDDSLYFNKYGNYESVGAYQSENSKYYSWYCFKDFPDDYLSWWGIDTLPTINKNNKEFEDFIAGKNGVIEKYASLGAAGFRLDVVDEIPDEFVRKIYDKIHEIYNDGIVIGEVWEDATNKIAYDVRRTYFTEPELDGVMNYPLKNAIINYVITGESGKLLNEVRRQLDHYPEFALNNLMNILGTHDTPRILTVLGKGGRLATRRTDMANEVLTEEEIALGIKRLKCATLLQFFLYGFPSVYYGDETGMQGNKDPFNRKCFDLSRANDEILKWYKFIAALRNGHKCLSQGKIDNVYAKNGLIAFTQTGDKEVALIVVNAGDKIAEIKLKNATYEFMRDIKTDKITVNTYEYAIFYKSRNGR